MRKVIRKFILGKKESSDTYIKYLKKLGMEIGEDVIVYAPTKTFIDEQYPWMISIGNHVRITEGVKILTHDYSWSVLKGLENNQGGAIIGSSGYIVIGDNVFIGMNTIITRNVKIGNNVIIGVGSVVTKDCEDNGVYAGNPAKRIMDIDVFYAKRLEAQVEEAKELAIRYYYRFGKKPKKEVFHEYFMLFSEDKDVLNNTVFNNKINLGNNRQQSIKYMKENTPKFKSYNEFMSYCFDEK